MRKLGHRRDYAELKLTEIKFGNKSGIQNKTEGKKTKKRLNFEASSSSTTSDENNGEMKPLWNHVRQNNEDECTECLEMYRETTSTSDWIQCVTCGRWLHESCTIYSNKCIDCGRRQVRAANKKTLKLWKWKWSNFKLNVLSSNLMLICNSIWACFFWFFNFFL